MRRHGPVIAHCTDSENFPKFVWSNSRKKAGIDCFYKELHVATAATATIIIRDANDVAGVWDGFSNFTKLFPIV